MSEKGSGRSSPPTRSISDIDGDAGRLWYAGYEIGDLARHATFEETIYLLHNLELPNRQQLISSNLPGRASGSSIRSSPA
jgi:citrate synthase